MQTKIQNILEEKGNEVISIQKNSTIDEIVKIMNDNHIGAIVVLDGEAVVGIVSERDLLRKFLAENKDPSTTTAGDIMTDRLVIATIGNTCEECIVTMTLHHIRHLPVYDGKDLVGIISIGDLMKSLAKDRDTEVHYLQDYIAGPYA